MSNSPRPIRVLLVEDNPNDVEIARRALGKSSARTELTVARDGQEALDILHSHGNGEVPKPDLILLDLNLPRVDGREVLQEAKTDPDLRRIPIVVLTVSTEEEDVIRCYDTGVNTYITKPVRFEDFMKAVMTIDDYWVVTATLPPVE
jgi:chemotaxis family two-component system response regulator Rcp1